MVSLCISTILPNNQITALPYPFDMPDQAQVAFTPGSPAQEFWHMFVHNITLLCAEQKDTFGNFDYLISSNGHSAGVSVFSP